ncbi:MAG: hypothetical protein ACE5HP_04760 [Gemmatimonadota bacterium]
MTRRRRKRLVDRVTTGTVALTSGLVGCKEATTGCSGCNDNGAVDPPPPPLQCDQVNEGQTLRASASVQGTSLDVTIDHQASRQGWRSVSITEVQGATLSGLRIAGTRVNVTLALESATTSQGSFKLEGELQGPMEGSTCTVRRTFNFTISDGTVEVAVLSDGTLPLAARQRAEILLVAQDGRRVEVKGRTPYLGPRRFAWTISAGRVLEAEGDRLVWEVPPGPGFYQVELVVDYGDDGLALDTLAFEVA